MTCQIPRGAFYKIWEGSNLIDAMRDDLDLLLRERRYVSLATLLVCGIEALAVGRAGYSGRQRQVKAVKDYVKSELPEMCAALSRYRRKRSAAMSPESAIEKGADIYYEHFRVGFTHLRAPKGNFAIAENHELCGQWADWIQIEGQAEELFALNVDRFTRELLALLERRRKRP